MKPKPEPFPDPNGVSLDRPAGLFRGEYKNYTGILFSQPGPQGLVLCPEKWTEWLGTEAPQENEMLQDGKATPLSFKEFRTKFATEEDCRNYLFEERFPEGFVCPKCGGSELDTSKSVVLISARVADARLL